MGTGEHKPYIDQLEWIVSIAGLLGTKDFLFYELYKSFPHWRAHMNE
jgi:hypothetical protein